MTGNFNQMKASKEGPTINHSWGRPTRKFTHLPTILCVAFPLLSSLSAETIFTIPQGFTKITIAGADEPGATKLTAISASLMNEPSFQGPVALGTYTDEPDPGPDSQTLIIDGVTWSPTQWTNEPHLAYLSMADDAGNADGLPPAEEAFLIIDNDESGTLTVDTKFDLATRFPADTKITIRKALTLNSFFGDSSENFASSDLVYLWSGSRWQAFQFVQLLGSGFWAATTAGFTDVGDTTIIYPDEGLFISRTEESSIVVTLLGEVPIAPQISTIEGAAFVASRFPVDTTILDTGIANDNWQDSDLLYIWNQTASPSPKWESYQFVRIVEPGFWASTSAGFTPANNTVIAANSAMFVVRANPLSAEDAATISTPPFGGSGND